MNQTKKDIIKNTLQKLNFVNWDRYFGESVLTFFGWIDREKDNYKDFVAVDFFFDENSVSISFTTSSKKIFKENFRDP